MTIEANSNDGADNQEQEVKETVPVEEKKQPSSNAFQAIKEEKNLYREKYESSKEEIKNLKSEFDTLKNQLKEKEIFELKTKAYQQAKGSIGDEFELSNETQLFEVINKLAYNEESYENDIKNLIDLAKKPKVMKSVQSPIITAPTQNKSAMEYTDKELRDLADVDKELFYQISKERLNILKSKRK